MSSMQSLSWDELREKVRDIFSSDTVDVDQVKRVMGAYRSDRNDWKKYAYFDTYRYTRNLVDEGNGKYNLLVLCWGEGHASCIHDHADSHCFMKMLDGTLKESMFSWPTGCEGGGGGGEVGESLTELGSHCYARDDVAYINDSMGLHRVENPSHTDQAVSLHLYSPPISTCKSFEQRTGQSHSCRVTFYSKDGSRDCK